MEEGKVVKTSYFILAMSQKCDERKNIVLARWNLTIKFQKIFASSNFQELDGRSLLLMQRSDVVTGLGLRLGPALKVYSHVKRFQLCQQCNNKNNF